MTCGALAYGGYCFIAGRASIGSGEFLQWSKNAGSWNLPADPDGTSQYGVPATDVHCSNDCVGVKSGNGTTAGTSTVLGYVVLSNNRPQDGPSRCWSGRGTRSYLARFRRVPAASAGVGRPPQVR